MIKDSAILLSSLTGYFYLIGYVSLAIKSAELGIKISFMDYDTPYLILVGFLSLFSALFSSILVFGSLIIIIIISYFLYKKDKNVIATLIFLICSYFLIIFIEMESAKDNKILWANCFKNEQCTGINTIQEVTFKFESKNSMIKVVKGIIVMSSSKAVVLKRENDTLVIPKKNILLSKFDNVSIKN